MNKPMIGFIGHDRENQLHQRPRHAMIATTLSINAPGRR